MEMTLGQTPQAQTLCSLALLIPLLCVLGCSPRKPTSASTATNQVTGAFGFVLGEKFTTGPGWKKDDDGGYSCQLRDTNQPFNTIVVFADEQGRIYSVDGSAVSRDANNLFESTKRVLAEKYPAIGKGLVGVMFGDSKRNVNLTARNNVVEINYADRELLGAFYDRVDKAKDADTRNSLRGKL